MNDEAEAAGLTGLPSLVWDRFEDSVGLAKKRKPTITKAPDTQYAQAGIVDIKTVRNLLETVELAEGELANTLSIARASLRTD